MKCFSIISLLLLILPLGTGCAVTRSVSIGSWQKSLDNYVTTQGNGDMSSLRELGTDPARSQFVALGTKKPQDSTDAVGVLLGRRNVNGKPWYIYIVGIVKKQELTDVRIATRCDGENNPPWHVSENDPSTLQTFIQYKNEQWRRNHAGRNSAPIPPAIFPAEEDDFKLTVAANTVTVTDLTSGAQWSLAIPSKMMAQSIGR